MKTVMVSSSFIESYTYTKDTLEITFKNGDIYFYVDIPKSILKEIEESNSFGKVYNDSIKGKYSFMKV